MRDHLEKYITEHRKSLDIYEPDDRLWERIDREINPPVKHRFPTWMKIAATVAIILGIAYTFMQLRSTSNQQQLVQDTPTEEVPVQKFYTPELQEVESYYTQLIANQQAQLRAYKAAGIEVDESFMEQLDALSKSYGNLQNELVEGEDAQLVIAAMIQNLMLQMEILNQQLIIMEQIKSWQHEETKIL